jgi:hypothetical protein
MKCLIVQSNDCLSSYVNFHMGVMYVPTNSALKHFYILTITIMVLCVCVCVCARACQHLCMYVLH